MWFLWENSQRNKNSCMLMFIIGNCGDFCPPFPVESLTSAFPLPTAWLLQSQGDAPHASSSSNVPPLQSSLHWRLSISTCSLCEHLQGVREDASLHHGHQSCLFPSGKIFPSGNMCYFLLQIFLRLFFTLSVSSNISVSFIHISTDTQNQRCQVSSL